MAGVIEDVLKDVLMVWLKNDCFVASLTTILLKNRGIIQV
jgi:hypothetical protein